MASVELDSRQRQHLKGLAHHLKPVVHIGKDGLTPALLSQIENALLSHELIKVKLGESAPMDRKEAQAALPEKTGAAFVQNVGKVFVLYRAHPEEPRLELPPPRRAEDAEGEEGGSGGGEGGDLAESGLPTSVRRRGAAPGPSAPSPRGRGPRPGPRRGGTARGEKPPRRASERRQHKRGGGRNR